MSALLSLNINVVTLANNHILDYGEKGVSDTIEFCKKNNIKIVGAGLNLEEASKTLYLNSKEGLIAIVNIAENEWASATINSAGANPMNIIDNSKQIKKAKDKANYVIVIIHGGHEYYNLPSPRMQQHYRFFADQGADIVVGHHPHCISGYEIYNGVPIFYSLGNFLFTEKDINLDWYKGLVLEIDLAKGDLQTKLHPVKQDKNTFHLSILKNKEKQIIIDKIEKYSYVIANKNILEKSWQEYIESKINLYLKLWSPVSFIKNKYLGGVLRKLPVKFINKSGLALYLNLMRCEAHRDLSKAVIERYLKNNDI